MCNTNDVDKIGQCFNLFFGSSSGDSDLYGGLKLASSIISLTRRKTWSVLS